MNFLILIFLLIFIYEIIPFNSKYRNILRKFDLKYDESIDIDTQTNDNNQKVLEFPKFLVTTETLWSSRRKVIKSVASIKYKRQPLKLVKEKVDSKEQDSSSIVTSSIFVALTILIVRFGGRVLLFQLLGIGSLIDDSTNQQIDEFLNYFNSLEGFQFGLFLLAWVIVKGFCIDFAGVGLALSSGILFGGFFQGTLATVLSSSLASLSTFYLSRFKLRDFARNEIEKRPALRAIDRACTNKGFQTVLTLRLSPILPIPIGAYNYIYGASSVSATNFFAGTFLGCIKPYALDCYLGLLAKETLLPQQTIRSDSYFGFTNQDLLLILAVLAITAVGTYAGQLGSSLFQELQAEANLDKNNKVKSIILSIVCNYFNCNYSTL